jgi:hypothetical protein
VTEKRPRGRRSRHVGELAESGRHRGAPTGEPFEASFLALGSLAYADARVSASAADLDSGEVLLAIDERVSLPTAEVGSLLLLIEVAAQLADGRLSPADEVARDSAVDETRVDDPRAGGLWSSLLAPSLTVLDAATLVASVSTPFTRERNPSGFAARRCSISRGLPAAPTTPHSSRSARPSNCRAWCEASSAAIASTRE